MRPWLGWLAVAALVAVGGFLFLTRATVLFDCHFAAEVPSENGVLYRGYLCDRGVFLFAPYFGQSRPATKIGVRHEGRLDLSPL